MSLREQAVRKYANDVLDEVGLSGEPVDPFEIASEKGLRLETRSGFPPGVYGALYFDGSEFGIVISDRCHGPGHRNFTIGHELGHFHIDGHAEHMFGGESGQVLSQGGHFRNRKDRHEREADRFASELLMPERWAAPLARELPGCVDTIAALAERFSASLCCAAIRFAELTDDAVAVVVSRERQIEWIAFSGRLQEHSWTHRAFKREFVPGGTATARLAASPQRVRYGEREDSSSLLCEWFDGAPSVVLTDEEAVGLGDYGRVITLLTVGMLPTAEELDEERQEQSWRERDWRDSLRGYELG
jgi:Zn-dependent peptidase ImmA (M78 family)